MFGNTSITSKISPNFQNIRVRNHHTSAKSVEIKAISIEKIPLRSKANCEELIIKKGSSKIEIEAGNQPETGTKTDDQKKRETLVASRRRSLVLSIGHSGSIFLLFFFCFLQICIYFPIISDLFIFSLS